MNAEDDVISLLRPRQWTKNLAVFAALVFSGELVAAESLGRSTLGFVALCFISSAIYAANDALDAECDRVHPVKKSRPVAAGRVTVAAAWVVSAVLLVSGLAISAWLDVRFLVWVCVFVVMQLLYQFWFKHIVILDMLVIALGFTVRAIAGTALLTLPISPWLVICATLLALFLAAAKRRHEIQILGDSSEEHRGVLAEYSTELLDNFMVTLSAPTITCYALYTFFEPLKPGSSMMITIPFVVYGVLRYQYLSVQKNVGGRPEEILLGDRPIALTVVLWVMTVIVILYVI